MCCTPEEELIFLCNLFGSCSKRSQGAGGNVSIKDGNHFYIKASGVRLTSVTKHKGYVICDLSGVLKLFHENIEQLESTVIFGATQKPSMEAFMHLLGPRYIVHFHPSFFCKILCSKESSSVFSKDNFPNSLYIPYVKPGIQLGKTILSNWKGESVLFLENHGVVLLSDTIESLVENYTHIVKQLEEIIQAQDTASPIQVEYLLAKNFACSIKPIYSVNHLPNYFSPITPDHFLFLQSSPLLTNWNEVEEDILLWKNKCNSPPSFLQVNTQIYAVGKSWEDCLNKEEYLLSYLDILSPKSTSLTIEDQDSLSQCPKELFRLHNQ